ncbi:MAG: cysteine--tRNA ligase [Acidimicrobiales bacterium]
MLRVHDTARGQTVDFDPREPGKVSMYVCGPTVYDVPHIGHGRFALVFDVIRRYLEWTGLDVRFVSNITDIEDKIINKAKEEGRSTEAVVEEYTAAWYDALDALGVRRPDADPRATGYVDQMVAFIADLVDRGRAYETPDGVYFIVETLEGYGLLARQSLESLKAGAGDRAVFGEDHKRSPADFALWKKAKPNEPAWDSPWEQGRPGWHIECTVMALDLLGDGFDFHGGGDDLCFPHHENERAQALGAGHTYARYWLHNGMVNAGGQKMSKSTGNFTSLTDLLTKVDPRAYRLLVLRAHYRSPIEVTGENLADATEAVGRLDNLVRRTAALLAADTSPEADALDRFRAAMDDDFNTPGATAVLFDLVRAANGALDAGDESSAAAKTAAALEIASALGLETRVVDDDVDDASAALAAERDAARAAKDFARADQIRDELLALGWVIEDTPSGTRLTR